jgi:hypothetical protein
MQNADDAIKQTRRVLERIKNRWWLICRLADFRLNQAQSYDAAIRQTGRTGLRPAQNFQMSWR